MSAETTQKTITPSNLKRMRTLLSLMEDRVDIEGPYNESKVVKIPLPIMEKRGLVPDDIRDLVGLINQIHPNTIEILSDRVHREVTRKVRGPLYDENNLAHVETFQRNKKEGLGSWVYTHGRFLGISYEDLNSRIILGILDFPAWEKFKQKIVPKKVPKIKIMIGNSGVWRADNPALRYEIRNQRRKILDHIIQRKRIKLSSFSLLLDMEPSNLSRDIGGPDGINDIFKRNLEVKEDLIIHSVSNGYSLNRSTYSFSIKYDN